MQISCRDRHKENLAGSDRVMINGTRAKKGHDGDAGIGGVIIVRMMMIMTMIIMMTMLTMMMMTTTMIR